jgi:hypothetical protein
VLLIRHTQGIISRYHLVVSNLHHRLKKNGGKGNSNLMLVSTILYVPRWQPYWKMAEFKIMLKQI